MDVNALIAAINLLVEQMVHEADDLHEVHLKLREHLDQLKATGMPLPEDLVELERRLTADVEGAAAIGRAVSRNSGAGRRSGDVALGQ